MKTKIGILVLALFTSFYNVQAQRTVTTTRATSYDISDNLDLDAVASIFGDSENLEDFEHRLNDPDNHISNLDLNQDGYIDYLRVVENSSDRNSLVVIQAVLDKDVYQDVATIEIERERNGNPRVQIVGNDYIYGPDYIIEPVYVHTPLIFSFFWSPRYVSYYSPYYWGYYPRYFHSYRPYSPFRYQRYVYSHINRYNTYRRSSDRSFQFSGDNYNQIRRNDYANRYPNRAFQNRNEGVRNRFELNERRPQVSRQRNNDLQRSDNPQYQYNRPSNSGMNERQRNVDRNRSQESNVQSSPDQNRTRENSNIDSRRQRPVPSNKSEQIRSGRNEGSSVSIPNRPANRIESAPRNSAPRERAGNVSGRNRSEVKQAARSERKAETVKRDDKKESGNNRRRE
ncbi:MAG TPA: hypothetical protein DCL77_10480 [Prolixibacteraceae bacterium]|jgi:hypothetical protein|nr:hypothetical protein [Prolixibacteraceae bacterium]